mmetsp:Transcript_29906/g.63725  ORF Transcript_29906/g.63725 Transcript_29906/m.63725 type:complete len:201 (+) Transcript_29906:322-924(+)
MATRGSGRRSGRGGRRVPQTQQGLGRKLQRKLWRKESLRWTRPRGTWAAAASSRRWAYRAPAAGRAAGRGRAPPSRRRPWPPRTGEAAPTGWRLPTARQMARARRGPLAIPAAGKPCLWERRRSRARRRTTTCTSACRTATCTTETPPSPHSRSDSSTPGPTRFTTSSRLAGRTSRPTRAWWWSRMCWTRGRRARSSTCA